LAQASAALGISQQIDDARGVADASEVMGIIAKYRGDLQTACEHQERSLELYRGLGDLARTAQACNNVGDSYRLWGQMERALEHLNEGLALARRVGNTRDEALLLQTTAEVFLDQGRWESAVAHLEQALALAEESEVVARIIEVHRILGLAYEGVGRLEDARRHLELAEAICWETKHLRFAPQIYLNLASLRTTQGESDEARRYAELALDAAGTEPSEVFLGRWHRCRGNIRFRCEDWDGAVADLEDSLRLLERAQVPAQVGKTCLSLGMGYIRRGQEGDRGRAREQLHAALSIFRQIQAAGYLARAEACLRELG
jgi:tetratricopeptide (TPR) repeat protein